jgi:serine phosphatase RsbU (regulator of sigma subunit)
VVRVCQADHPIGTLWLFRERAKKFRRHDLASAELLAGQLAAALERDALLGEAGQARTLRRDVRSAALQQQTQLPVPMPLAEGWDVAGWLDAPLEPSGQWYHWDITRDGRIALVVASDAGDLGRFGAAINAAQLRAAWQIASMQMHQPAKVLQAVNDALWQVSTAPQPSNLFDVRLSPESGAFDLAAAGSTHAIIVGTYGYRPLVAHSRPLGTQPDVRPITHQGNLQPGEILLIATDTLVAHQSEPSSGRLTQTELIAPIQEQIGKSAEEMLAAVRRRLVASKTNRSMVVLSRSAR